MKKRIEHINKYEGRVKSFVKGTFDNDRILEDWTKNQSKASIKFPLKDLLFGVKDIINVDGYPTRCGSLLPSELFKGSQASCVSKLLNAGAIFAGKTVTAEFAVSDPGETRNPRNLFHTPGGSSSGSGASVAAGFCDIAIGTQTSGSVIRPAGYCGVVGYKPSFGRISRDGVLLFSNSMDHVGLCTSDLDVLEKVLPLIVDGWRFQKPKVIKNISIGIPEGSYINLSKPNVLKQFLDTIQLLKEKFYIKNLELVRDIESYNRKIDEITFAELYKVHSVWFQRYKELYGPIVRKTIEAGKKISPEDFTSLTNRSRKDRKLLQMLMIEKGIDIWIAPVAPDVAPFGIDSTGDFRMNSIWSYTGLPVITIPTGINENNLPYSIQIVGRFGEDEKLLKISKIIGEILKVPQIQNSWELHQFK
jgi:Asp-tRNA(Asn)/Glu-tRNA(Gln) amidotransferase A subunit family amidase